MNKLFTKILLGVLAVFLFTGSSFAATSTSVRLQQPASQTNKDDFTITFVALDTKPTQTVTVQCQKMGPGDIDWVNFGPLMSFDNGGDTSICQANSSMVNQNDFTYQFRVIANGSSLDVQSNVVDVKFNNQAPGTPVNYSKTKPDNCTYKISLRSANDSGKTVKVVLYRSTETSFSLDAGHQVNTLSIGSDTDGFMTDNVSPNCSTEYFYVIRAFDVYGNGSGVVGDSSVTTTTVNPTTTQTQGAIPVGGTGGGSVLGSQTGEKEEVLGTESAEKKASEEDKLKAGQNPVTNLTNWVLTHKKISLLVLLILGAVTYYLYRRYKK
jgi:hypothetical protein